MHGEQGRLPARCSALVPGRQPWMWIHESQRRKGRQEEGKIVISPQRKGEIERGDRKRDSVVRPQRRRKGR